MGANIWFWLIFVIVGVFGGFGMRPWQTSPSAWGYFGGYLVLLILIGILGLHDFGMPIR